MALSIPTIDWRLVKRDRKAQARLALGVLLLLNLLASYFVMNPPGGSSEALETQIASARGQILRNKAQLARLKALAGKMELATSQTAEFETTYFMDRRTASSTIVSELVKAAKETGVRPKEHAFVFEPVEGSDSLSMMTITGNFEGTYADLIQAIHRIDQSKRFLILDTLQATPQLGTGLLNINLKMNAFVRDSAGSAAVKAAAQLASAAPGGGQ
jgi:hypothetical protein